MKCDKKHMRLYAVTDSAWVGKQTLAQQVEAAILGGATCIQLREKHLCRDAILAQALELAPICKKYGVPFIVNDDVEIALASGADGVHVGQEDMRIAGVRERAGGKLIIGVSAHNVAEALEAQRNGADYLGVGAVFATSTKTNVHTMTPELLRSICDAVDIPVVAIGGINLENMPRLSGCGMDGVALVSAIFAAEDITEACKRLRALSEEITNR